MRDACHQNASTPVKMEDSASPAMTVAQSVHASNAGQLFFIMIKLLSQIKLIKYFLSDVPETLKNYAL